MQDNSCYANLCLGGGTASNIEAQHHQDVEVGNTTTLGTVVNTTETRLNGMRRTSTRGDRSRSSERRNGTTTTTTTTTRYETDASGQSGGGVTGFLSDVTPSAPPVVASVAAVAGGTALGSLMGSGNNNNNTTTTTTTLSDATKDLASKYRENSVTSAETNGDHNIAATVYMISGCEDHQTSADVSNVSNFSLPDPNGKAGGACTSALLKVLYGQQSNTTDSMTFLRVLGRMRSTLRMDGYTQIPQLTSSEPIDTSHDFFLVPPNCKGTKRAVLIGINYTGQSGELSGCHNDCLNMKDYIVNVLGFHEENIVVLMDDGEHHQPTRENILNAYKAVTSQTASGDAVFCHYSGHGGRIRDDEWEEKDGYDETLIPVDYASSGQIRDDDLYKTLVCAMPSGSTLVSLMDCCHSATVLDLPYKYQARWSNGEVNPTCNNTLLCCGFCLILVIAVPAAVLSFT